MDNIVGLWLDIAGWGGAVAILASYLSVSMGWLRAGRRFQAANLVGSVAFIVNGSYYGAWPSVVTNVAWFVISAVALVRMQRAASRAAQAPEAAPVEAAAPQAPAHPVPVVTASVPLVPVPAEGWPRLPGDELTLDYKVRT
ncbi:CBU_0592 family membrane protein [Arthrobacter silvisoli]|uniref:CBU_0592 family membrane protein n=1 Tax=Arthrobacter silvisoli TaxID=2291022 RepID=UPI000E213161